jgi:hypothetical protein
MSDEPAQNGTAPDEVEHEQVPKPKSGEEAKAARSMDAMQANQEQTASADVDDAKLATVNARLFINLLLQAMSSLTGGAKSIKADEPNKKVILKKEDVTVIVRCPDFNLTAQMTEFDMPKTTAEKALRGNRGELITTIKQLINV